MVLCLLMAEAALRILKRTTAFQPDPDLIRWRLANWNEPITSWETADNLNGRSNQIPDEPIPVGIRHTNNLGLRMAKDVGPKRQDEHRILILGDSFTEAVDAPYERRFDGLAEGILKGRGSDWERWTMVNAGIMNGSPSQYLLILRRLIPKVGPDFVIVVTGSNDLGDDMLFERQYGFVLDEDGVPLRPREQLQLWMLQHSYLLRYVHVFLALFVPSLESVIFRPADDSVVPLNWATLSCRLQPEAVRSFEERTGRYLLQLETMANSAGAQFGVLVIHYLYSFANEPFYAKRFPSMIADLVKDHCYEANARPYVEFVDRFLERNRISYRDTHGAFLAAKREAPTRKLWNFFDYHFSPAGHEIVAGELAKLVLEMHDKVETSNADRAGPGE
jgi:lysophospholipase L1-like esterase